VSMRKTWPRWPAVTYSAPSGPIVLPEPHVPLHPGAKVASSVTAGACECRLPAAGEGNATVTAAMTTTAILDASLVPMTASFIAVGNAAPPSLGRAPPRKAVARLSRSPTLLQTAQTCQPLRPITDHQRHKPRPQRGKLSSATFAIEFHALGRSAASAFRGEPAAPRRPTQQRSDARRGAPSSTPEPRSRSLTMRAYSSSQRERLEPPSQRNRPTPVLASPPSSTFSRRGSPFACACRRPRRRRRRPSARLTTDDVARGRCKRKRNCSELRYQ
jgi:hypothetical protein